MSTPPKTAVRRSMVTRKQTISHLATSTVYPGAGDDPAVLLDKLGKWFPTQFDGQLAALKKGQRVRKIHLVVLLTVEEETRTRPAGGAVRRNHVEPADEHA